MEQTGMNEEELKRVNNCFDNKKRKKYMFNVGATNQSLQKSKSNYSITK
jgi:hypothetical protein